MNIHSDLYEESCVIDRAERRVSAMGASFSSVPHGNNSELNHISLALSSANRSLRRTERKIDKQSGFDRFETGLTTRRVGL